MCGNIGTIIGPILGGLLADPAGNYPGLFGGIKWLKKYPYAPPNLLSAAFLASACLAVVFALEEVSLLIILSIQGTFSLIRTDSRDVRSQGRLGH